MIAYASRTGNVRFIAKQLGLPGVEIRDDMTISEPFLLMTFTDGLGQVPPIVQRFMDRNGSYCKGVAVSGNSNFGHHLFGRAGDTIAKEWNIPLVRKIELRGYSQDYEAIRQFYQEHIREVSRHEIVPATQ
jgi:protein involved in ribonucleotide reduction